MKKLLFALLYRAGATRLAARWNRRRVMILCYHGVTMRAERSPKDPAGLHIRIDRFRKQLDHLQRRYQVISLHEFVKASREGRQLPPQAVVLTFDDGYRNFLTAAAPELAEKNFPATVFLITDRVRDDSLPTREWSEQDDESCLSWTEARSLNQEQGIEFGSHTRSHGKLSTLATDDSERELRESFAAIQDRLKVDSLSLAYPFGDHSDIVIGQARDAGYDCALTTEDGGNAPSANLYTLRRTLIGDDDDEASFAIRASGLISSISRRKRAVK